MCDLISDTGASLKMISFLPLILLKSTIICHAQTINKVYAFTQGHGSDVDYINPIRVCFGEDVKALQVSCGFNHTGAVIEYA